MRLIFSVFLVGCMVAAVVAADPPAANPAGQGQADAENETSVWMVKKLEYSQAILQGLAMADFEAIKSNGVRLHLLNKVEGFVRRSNPRYKRHVRAFEEICDEIVDQADQENLAGVTLAFNQLTINCVNCHRSLRNEDKPEGQAAREPK